MTNEVDRRLKEHNNGENSSTKAYCPYELIYKEVFDSSIEARTRKNILRVEQVKSS